MRNVMRLEIQTAIKAITPRLARTSILSDLLNSRGSGAYGRGIIAWAKAGVNSRNAVEIYARLWPDGNHESLGRPISAASALCIVIYNAFAG